MQLVDHGKVVDSTVASVISNLGLTGLSLYFLFFALMIFQSILKKNNFEFVFFSSVFLFGLTAIITETFPIYVKVFILTACLIKNNFNVK